MSSSTFMTEFLRSGASEADIDRIFAECDQDSLQMVSTVDDTLDQDDIPSNQAANEAQAEAA
jgi:hypothetical protein